MFFCRVGFESCARRSSERPWVEAQTAVGGEGSFGKEAHQLSIGLLREGASAGFAQISVFRNKKFISRELGRPS